MTTLSLSLVLKSERRPSRCWEGDKHFVGSGEDRGEGTEAYMLPITVLGGQGLQGTLTAATMSPKHSMDKPGSNMAKLFTLGEPHRLGQGKHQ